MVYVKFFTDKPVSQRAVWSSIKFHYLFNTTSSILIRRENDQILLHTCYNVNLNRYEKQWIIDAIKAQFLARSQLFKGTKVDKSTYNT